MTKQRGNRKTRIGVVVSDKMDKTVVVRVDQVVKHPVYQKYIKRKVTCKAHDEQNSCQIGDKVLIVESRPLSRDKCWAVRQILVKTTNV
ncbi:SSU ribosomal protein S17P [Geoalkalibacter ferrihydriticus]|uniref:Small ribosomal subunit protein uS17 n=2 Tax=Geoalkalibacter ferrihydriticus TaxID=392333 RepID=A0A0C2HQK9_9BACT|nr:30S ribosomal protein S17 [Geoalkalibacter ferrihydriticus]KIH77135.1 30S ribosomal protein S17 [Geoalkalibacter ferrihydriticus DSM 17813]SDL32990.1 SSU ribosomal protein S17P [Geoalkalibacter ferrihydriticus]